MNSTNHPVVVVGVSGSDASAVALRWAADEARRRHGTLQVVRTWDAEFDAPCAPLDVQIAAARQRAIAREGLAATMRTSFGSATPAGVLAELAQGVAERVLVARSATADLLVLGSAAPPAATGRSIGPVIRACLTRSQCPVVVVGADDQEETRPRAAGPRAHAGGAE